jgi:hypothetical protein
LARKRHLHHEQKKRKILHYDISADRLRQSLFSQLIRE